MAFNIRRRGAGSIWRDGRRNKWRAKGPQVKGVAQHLGWFDTYRQAETALDDFLARQQEQK